LPIAGGVTSTVFMYRSIFVGGRLSAVWVRAIATTRPTVPAPITSTQTIARRVVTADGHTSLITLETDIDVLAAVLTPGRYRLMVIDGIAGYLGSAKTHNDADVRRVLTPFVALLDRAHCAGFSVMHPPKAIVNLAYYAGGSVAFTGVPRVALGVAPRPER
jgi:AAA domain